MGPGLSRYHDCHPDFSWFIFLFLRVCRLRGIAGTGNLNGDRIYRRKYHGVGAMWSQLAQTDISIHAHTRHMSRFIR